MGGVVGRKVVIQKVDLDTALTSFLLGVSSADDIVVVRGEAAAEDLANPEVICIECGGSGEVEKNNFDHHAPDKDLPPACVQAFQHYYRRDLFLSPTEWGRHMTYLEFQLVPYVCPHLHNAPFEARLAVQEALATLVDYVAILDTRGPEELRQRSGLKEEAFPTLSDVFSGMLLCTKAPKEQLLLGISIFWALFEHNLHPFGVMPELPEWEEYIEAKRRHKEAVAKALGRAEFFMTRSGRRAAYIMAEEIGVVSALYSQGAEVVIAFCPRYGDPPGPKFTIAGHGVRVDHLLPYLSALEPGWGGPAHGTILGSLRTGTNLTPQEIISLVREHL